jgi:NADP-dependent 3-hydroxy acid dehydrogenase YdfG
MIMKNLHQLVVVITGASSGIGLKSAERFAKAGCRIALLARTADKLEKAAEEVRSLGAEVLALPTDVTDEAVVKQTFSTVQRTLGPVDILINNAGVGFATDLSKCAMADFRRMFETNVTGVFLCTREVLPSMKERQSGHIINISSIVGKVSNPNAPLYCSSKHALNGYNSGLQQQVAPDKIRVSLISPSAVDTAYWDGRQVDRGKFLKPEEIAEVVFFVASQPEGVLIKDIDLTAFR